MKKIILTLLAATTCLFASAQGWGPPDITRVELPYGLGMCIPSPHTVLPDGEFFEGLPDWSFPGKVDPVPVIQALMPDWVRLTNSRLMFHTVHGNYYQWEYDLEILPHEGNNPRQLIVSYINEYGYPTEFTLTQLPRY